MYSLRVALKLQTCLQNIHSIIVHGWDGVFFRSNFDSKMQRTLKEVKLFVFPWDNIVSKFSIWSHVGRYKDVHFANSSTHKRKRERKREKKNNLLYFIFRYSMHFVIFTTSFWGKRVFDEIDASVKVVGVERTLTKRALFGWDKRDLNFSLTNSSVW